FLLYHAAHLVSSNNCTSGHAWPLFICDTAIDRSPRNRATSTARFPWEERCKETAICSRLPHAPALWSDYRQLRKRPKSRSRALIAALTLRRGMSLVSPTPSRTRI